MPVVSFFKGGLVQFSVEVRDEVEARDRAVERVDGDTIDGCSYVEILSDTEVRTKNLMPDIKQYIDAAYQHGVDSNPDHEVGDLQGYLRAMWNLLTPEQRIIFAGLPEVVELYVPAQYRGEVHRHASVSCGGTGGSHVENSEEVL